MISEKAVYCINEQCRPILVCIIETSISDTFLNVPSIMDRSTVGTNLAISTAPMIELLAGYNGSSLLRTPMVCNYVIVRGLCPVPNYHFPKRQSLHSSKLKEFADDNFRFNENGRKLVRRVEKTGKSY